MISFIVPPFVESFMFISDCTPFIGRAPFVYSASLGECVKFICYRLQPFLFSSWSGESFVVIIFIAALSSNIDIGESVLGFHSLLLLLCSGESPGVDCE